jgi:dienelactone hydrolase
VFVSSQPAKHIDRQADGENVRRYLEESEEIDCMKIVKRILIGLLVVVVAATIGLALWGNDAYPPQQPALDALESDAQVIVTQHDGFITFEPANIKPATGFVFYPGGRVDYRVYSPALHEIAARGYFVAVVKVRINLAFFDLNAAERVISRYPDIRHWAVGGHSLGGVAAASYASNHLDALDGLVFWASYPADDSLAASSLKVLSIYGTNDMAGMETFDKSRAQLPAETQFVTIEGGNHAQFGAYGPQDGDKVATIPAEEQWAQVADATAAFLESLDQ